MFDKVIRVFSKRKEIIEDFRFAMRYYLVEKQKSDYACDLDKMSFFENKDVFKDFMIVNGAAYKKDNRVIALLAGPYSGKTSALINEVKTGAQLISDDLLLVNKKTLNVYPLKKPVCFREKAIGLYGIKKEKLDENDIAYRYFYDEYGPRFVIHLFDVMDGYYVESPQTLTEIYMLNTSKKLYQEFMKLIKGFEKNDIGIVLTLYQKIKCLDSFNNITCENIITSEAG